METDWACACASARENTAFQSPHASRRRRTRAVAVAIGKMAATIALLLGAALADSRLPRNTTRCTLQDPYHCAAVPECGFCLTTWTCMVGNESGPAAYALPCEYNATLFDANCSWVFDANAIDTCAKEQHPTRINMPAGLPFHMQRPPTSPHDNCAPPEYDTLCVAGGQRHWGGCFFPYNDSHCQDAVATWGCARPTARVQLTRNVFPTRRASAPRRCTLACVLHACAAARRASR